MEFMLHVTKFPDLHLADHEHDIAASLKCDICSSSLIYTGSQVALPATPLSGPYPIGGDIITYECSKCKKQYKLRFHIFFIKTKGGLGPIVDANTKTVILGTFPGDASIRKGEYYSSPNNDFWKLVGETIGTDLNNLDYLEKIKILRENGIGLWDLFEDVERQSSADNQIKAVKMNDLEKIFKLAPHVKKIGLNGKEASKYSGDIDRIAKENGRNIEIIELPSSSGSNRKELIERNKRWIMLLC
jgi:hypoxanthine-DNA glycosylase